MRTLSTFYNRNTIKARRNLRSDIEKKVLEVSAECLEGLTLVKDQVARVQAEVNAMSTCCKEMSDRLDKARQQTRGVVEKTTEMQEKASSLECRLDVARAFSKRFQLSPSELKALTGGGTAPAVGRSLSLADGSHESRDAQSQSPLSDNFFDALARAKAIHTDCAVLLRTKHQIIGLEIMDQMSKLQEAAYERVFRYALAECHGLSRDLPDVKPVLRLALCALRDRRSLYKVCWEEIGSTRRTIVVRQFIDALAIGGPGGFPRPIEMHSHDPLRYVSDMLAWLHQTVAAEQEFILTLLTVPEHRQARSRSVNRLGRSNNGNTHSENQPNNHEPAESTEMGNSEFNSSTSPAPLRRMQSYDNVDTDPQKDKNVRDEVTELLTFVMEGTCRPFRSRLDQVLGSNPGITVCYRLSNLLHFYGHTIRQTINATSELVGVIEEGRMTSFKVFQDSLGIHSRKLRSDRTQPTENLLPTPVQTQTLTIVKEIAHSYSGSLMATSSGAESLLGIDVTEVLTTILDPLLEAAQHTSSAMATANRAVYMINTISAVQAALGIYEFADASLEAMEKKITVFVADVEHAQAMYVLSRTDLAGKLSMLNTQQHDNANAMTGYTSSEPVQSSAFTPLSTLPGMSAMEIKQVMGTFDKFLSMSHQGFSLPQIERITSSRIRKNVRTNAIAMIVSAYAQLYTAVLDPKNLYQEPQSVCPRTPAQVHTLLV
eukprot:CFRG7301T1